MSEQRDEAWVKSATPDAIHEALGQGELAHYLGGNTEDERSHHAHVKESPNRLLAEAYGFDSHAQMVAISSSYGSSMLAAKRADMTPQQVQKLDWLEAATPEEVFAAEKSGDLDNLLRRDVSNEAARIETIRNQVKDAVSAALGGR